MQLNSHEKQYKNIHIKQSGECYMSGYHIQNGSYCQFVVVANEFVWVNK